MIHMYELRFSEYSDGLEQQIRIYYYNSIQNFIEILKQTDPKEFAYRRFEVLEYGKTIFQTSSMSICTNQALVQTFIDTFIDLIEN